MTTRLGGVKCSATPNSPKINNTRTNVTSISLSDDSEDSDPSPFSCDDFDNFDVLDEDGDDDDDDDGSHGWLLDRLLVARLEGLEEGDVVCKTYDSSISSHC